MQTDEHTDYSGVTELQAIEASMPKYNTFISKLITNELETDSKAVDFGAGIGTLSDLFVIETGTKPACVEIDKSCREHLKEKGHHIFEKVSDLNSFDFVFSSNVLEHIEDDRAILDDISRHINENGKLVLYLPAFQLLFSDLDRSVGHYRRYDKKPLLTKLEESGFRIEKVHYADCVGFLVNLLFRIKGYKSENGLASTRSLKIYDKFVFPFSRLLDNLGIKYVFGKNIFVVARKPPTPKT